MKPIVNSTDFCETDTHNFTLEVAMGESPPESVGFRSIEDMQAASGDSWRTIKCAREFIEANLSEAISIGGICKNCAASCSKLERTFRRELAMSPTRYILARRLEAVNRALKDPQSSRNFIGRIAMDFGFTHLGRFASAYRAHFGELPSETVRLN